MTPGEDVCMICGHDSRSHGGASLGACRHSDTTGPCVCPRFVRRTHPPTEGPTAVRRLVFQHVRGPWAGLRQLLATYNGVVVEYLHGGGEMRAHTGPLPDVLAAFPWPPDKRWATALRLRSTDRYALYIEQHIEPLLVTRGVPDATD